MKEAIKVVTTNWTGNVGKSTLSQNMLLPRLIADYFDVETVNSNNSTAPKINGSNLDDIMDGIGVAESAIVDVGASNAEAYFQKMKEIEGSHEDITHFLVPCSEPLKQQHDTIATVEALSELSVPQSKIHVVFNNINPRTNIEHTFKGLFEYHRQLDRFQIYPETVIHSTSVFDRLRLLKIGIKEIIYDERDFLMLRNTAKTKEERLQWTVMLNLQRAARGVDIELDYLFKAVFGTQ